MQTNQTKGNLFMPYTYSFEDDDKDSVILSNSDTDVDLQTCHDYWSRFYWHRLILMQAWISNHMPNKV